MATSFPSVKDATLAKFLDALVACVRSPTGTAPDAAPNAFKDRLMKQVDTAETGEVKVTFQVNPGGQSAFAVIVPIGSKAPAILGSVDIATLAAKLA
jgi:hypothetical protein